ncbi:Mannose-binding lectin [Neofusicoccum parvum]|uniref:Mannose-binding lectin n=1 Tax=Neofusicoccum parvum TaxID=310453 RepID=A0ACB5RNJ2_9PEZI|nr:Mannose-binding lectin [Neofusicoccum parvum]
MPSFLKDFRRRSVRSFRTDTSSSDPANNGSGTSIPTSKSSSTLSSIYQQTTPPPSLPGESMFTNSKAVNGGPTPVPPVPQLPSRPATTATKRMSSIGLNGLATPPPKNPPTSAFAPRVLSIDNRAMVYQKVLLISGVIGEPDSKPMDGAISINHDKDAFPSTSWPVSDSHFKALVVLQPGANTLRLDFSSPKLSSSNTSIPAHSSWIDITYLPLNSAPPLHLAIILGKDSPGTFDAVPERIHGEGNGLETAVRKFRMAAYLWQAFTGEQMFRNGFGRRCWRYEEEWQQGTLTYNDQATGQYRNEAKIHIIRCDKTVEELRDLNIAQQYEKAADKGKLFGIAMEAVKAHFRPKAGQKQYVSCLFLDTHWDPQHKVVRGHAALGGGDGEVGLAIFGSHALQSYPASIEEVVPAFTDCTKTDTNFVANDCNESGSVWEAANIGIGAHMHETGHLFGCPHQESGVMLRDYVWTADNANILITAETGIAWIELYPQGDDVCHTWIEYLQNDGNMAGPRLLTLTEADLRAKLPADKRKKPLKLEVFSYGGAKHVVEDVSKLNSKASRTKLPDGRKGFIGSKLGFSQLEGSQPQEILLSSAYLSKSESRRTVLMSIRIYHGFAVDGIEFFYDDDTSQLFGKRGGQPGGSEFKLDTQKGEILMGFYLRAGLWIDGIQILTNRNRKSEIYGNPTGGSGHTLIPPRGYGIAGISGSCGQWLDGFALVIAR